VARILLENIKKIYGGRFTAVHNMNLSIDDREFVVFVGPSGCGKSTTLRMIAGLEKATAGKIYIGDRLVNHLPPKDRYIAMVFQTYALFPHMNVFDNIGFGLKIRKTPKGELNKLVAETAELLGLKDLLNRKPKELSGGQRQRVALGRAIVRKPDVFLFDEPLSNLDAKLRVQMRTEIKKLHERLQTTMIYVTHDQVEAMTMGTRIVVLNMGIVQQVGAPLSLYNQPANRFVAGFLGSPSMNFLPCKIIEKKSQLFINCSDFLLPLDQSRVKKIKATGDSAFLLGIRPEDIHKYSPVAATGLSEPITAIVNVIEPLGKEVFIEINTGIHDLSAIIESSQIVELHEKVQFRINLENIHLFRENEAEIAVF
jgi:multiple sugar transport system ATP-binding protein